MKLILLLTLLQLSMLSWAQELSPKSIINKTFVVKSLSKNDLELNFLDSILRNKRIVFLGESNHGDGTTWEAKSKIINYLILHLNYEVLIFEFNFFEMAKANAFLRNPNVDSKYVLKAALSYSSYWSEGRESIANVILLNKNRIQLGGLELSYGHWFRTLLDDDLLKFKVDKKILHAYITTLKDIDLIAQYADGAPEIAAIDFKKFESLTQTLLQQLTESKVKADRNCLSFLIQVIKSNMGLSEWVKNRTELPVDRLKVIEWTKVRDKYLSDNLLWLLSQKYPDKKIIVSTSTLHMSKNISGIPLMADYLPDSIKRQAYFLPFISYHGAYGQKADIPLYPIKTFKRDSLSLEFHFHDNGIGYGLLHLNSLSIRERDFLNSLNILPSLALNSRANWVSIYDGFFFIDCMKPDSLKPFTIKDYEYFEKVLYKLK